MNTSLLPLICAVIMGITGITAHMTELKWLYWVSGASMGFLFGASMAIEGLHKLVKGRKMTADEEEIVMKQVFKI